jgi:septal ring factor EnvC (AmiA/AmiB activator)
MRTLMISFFLLTVMLGVAAAAEQDDYLSDDEVDELREAQGPSERIEKYLAFAQVRLTRFDDYRSRRPDPEYDIPAYLDTQLDQFIHITDAMKDWIEDHFDRRDDMRAGLKKIVEMGPHELEQLRHAEQTPNPYAAAYGKSLNDAIEDFTDALDGATKALNEQTKMFGELKREQKADAQEVKERQKDERKLNVQESKLRKKEHEKGPPTDPDED